MSTFVNFNNREEFITEGYSVRMIKKALYNVETKNVNRVNKLVEGLEGKIQLSKAISLFTDKLGAMSALDAAKTQVISEGQFSWFTQDSGTQIGSERQNRITVYMYDNKGNQYKESKYDGYGEFGGMDYYELLARMNGYTEEDLEAVKGPFKEMRQLGIDIAFGKLETKDKGKKVLFPALVEDPRYNWKRHDFTQEAESDPNQSWYQEEEYDEEDDYYYEAKEVKFAKTVTKKEWDKAPKDYKTVIDGVHYMLVNGGDMGTVLAPVEITEGNAFGAARAKAIANGEKEFTVDGETYPVENVDKEDKKNAKEFTSAVTEGTMSEIHILAKEAKDVAEFIKKFFKEFGDKVNKSKDTEEWVASLYADMVGESISLHENYEVIYSDGVSAMKKFRSEKQALDFMKQTIASNKKLRDIAVYKPGMYSTTQTELVVAFWGNGSYLDNVSKKDPELAAKKLEESAVTEASLSGIEFANDDDIHPTKFKPLVQSLKKNRVKMEVEKEEGMHGWPEVKLTGKRKDIEKVLADIWGPDSIEDYEDAYESVVTEAKYNKKSLLKKLGKADDAIIQTGNGKEYIIYNPDSNNDDNAAMWNDNSVFAVDQDGEEHEIKYSDIVSYNESVVTEAKFVKDFNRDVLNATTEDEVLKVYPKAEFFVGKMTHFFGELEPNLFFKAYYTKGSDFEIASIYSEKGGKYIHLWKNETYEARNESVVTEAMFSVNDLKKPGLIWWYNKKGDKAQVTKIDKIDNLNFPRAKDAPEGFNISWGMGTLDDWIEKTGEKNPKVGEVYDITESVVTEGRSINKIQKEWTQVTADMKITVDEWKKAEGDTKSQLLDKLKELTTRKRKLEVELDSAVGLKDADAELVGESYTDDDINMSYGFYGTINDNEGNDKITRALFDRSVKDLMKEYKLSEKEALNVLNSKMGRKAADQIVDGEAKTAIDGFESYYGKHLKKEMAAVKSIDEGKKLSWESLVESVNRPIINEDLRSNLKKYIKKNEDELNSLADNDDWESIHRLVRSKFGTEEGSREDKDLIDTFMFMF